MRTLAVEFGTSTMPVREALKRLASESGIQRAAAKAFNVPSLSDKRAADLFELRALLESAAVEAAHNELTSDMLDELSALCERRDAHLKLRDFRAYTADNHRFHFLLYRKADNPDMVSMIEQFWMKFGPSLYLGLQQSITADPDWNTGHKQLVEAIRDGRVNDFASIVRAEFDWGAAFYRSDSRQTHRQSSLHQSLPQT